MKWARKLTWPDELRALDERFGFDVLWFKCIAEFGFPPTWGLTGSQLVKLTALLLTEERHGTV